MAETGISTTKQTPSEVNQSLNDDKDNCSARLLDLEALDCPICRDALTSPIYQCDNGHVACSACCNKLRNKCPACAFPIGQIRCRAMERVIKSVIVPCPNAKLGCTESFAYGKEVIHEKGCAFSLCSCPMPNCKYTGSYQNLYFHFKVHEGERGRYYPLSVGETRSVYFEMSEYSLVFMKEDEEGLVFVLQCFSEPHGVYVTMSCIAPSAMNVGEFSCHISTFVLSKAMEYNMTFDLPKIKKVRKVSLKIPEEDFMLVPTYFFWGRQTLKLTICVRKVNQD